MALIRHQLIDDRLTGNTVELNYWKIVKVSIDKKKMKIGCDISLFRNREHAISCLYPAMTRTFQFNINGDQLYGNIFALAYEKIRENLDDCKLTGATDD